MRCFKRWYEDRCSLPYRGRRGSRTRVSVCSMRCDTRESARPSVVRPVAVVLHCTARPETPDELPARDDNGCRLLVGSTRFLRAAGERTITPHQLFTSSFLYAAPPLSRPLLRFVVHYDRVAWIAERGITLSLRLTTPHLNFFVFLSLSLSLSRSSTRSPFLDPILLFGHVETAAFLPSFFPQQFNFLECDWRRS